MLNVVLLASEVALPPKEACSFYSDTITLFKPIEVAVVISGHSLMKHDKTITKAASVKRFFTVRHVKNI